MSRPPDASPDAPLRANVRLLGEILGRVLTEQEGEDVYRLEERVRLLARLGRRGDTGAARALEETIAALDVETQAVVLRAFTVYFHLANIAEQHHRVRRRREHEREGGTPRESLAEALELLERDGVTRDGDRRRRAQGLRRARRDRASDRGAPAHDPREAPPDRPAPR